MINTAVANSTPTTPIGPGAAADALKTSNSSIPQDTMVPATPVIVPGVGAQQAAQPPVDQNSWMAPLSEANRVFLERKGIKDLDAAIKSYSDAEKFIGVPADKIIKLPEETDSEGWNTIFNKLGRPDKPEGYELNLGDEPDAKDFVDWASKTFHENGISKKAAHNILAKYAEYAKSGEAKTEAAAKAKMESETTAIKQEWGAAYEQKLEMAKAFAAKSGIKSEQIDVMEKSIGYAATLKFFADLGSKIGEDNFVSGGKMADGQLTPQAAREEIDSLSPDFINRLQNGDLEASRKWDQLHRNLLGIK